MEYSGPILNKRDLDKPFCINFLPTNGFVQARFIDVLDGDTAIFEVQGFQEIVRFMVIDTLPIFPDKTLLGEEATIVTKNILSNATEIYLESDVNNNLRDNTMSQRLLAWIWVDGKLLNYILVRNGLALVKYIIDSKMKYLNVLDEALNMAKKEKLGIFKDEI